MNTTKCFVCSAIVPDILGPVCEHSYMPQSPGCWKLYTEVLAREFSEWRYPSIHRLTVDCYAAQHPTKEHSQKSAQSVTVHLVAIYLVIEKNISPQEVTSKMREIVDKNKGKFLWLNPPENLGNITVAAVHQAVDLEDHITIVKKWAVSVWDAWKKYHELIKEIAYTK